MIEKWKILVLIGAAVWAVFFVVISILMFTLESIPWLYWILEWILAAAIGYFVTKMILKKYGGGMIEGLKYGAILLGITLIFDLAITAPWFAGGYVAFLSNWVMWVGIAISLAAAAFAGKQNESQPDVPSQTPQAPTSPPVPTIPDQS
ncbi:hypothetical protein KKA15_06380 [Patescibacteria group bacterium]|nr:hypothetical protein [Patescibacteria group bacterium]